MTAVGTLLLVGAGRMGRAMLGAWAEDAALKPALYVLQPGAEKQAALAAEFGVRTAASPAGLPLREMPQPVIVVFAVKPQKLPEILPEYAALREHLAAVISIAAGRDLAFYEAAFGPEMPIYRVMPNLPVVVGQGYSFAVQNDAAFRLKNMQRTDYAEALFRRFGILHSGHKNEHEINAVTAIAGSGPAYLYAVMEAWIKAGVALGLEPGEARRMVRQTVAGAVALQQKENQSEVELIRAVASPGGTTEAALGVFAANNRLEALFSEAVAAAVSRAGALAGAAADR